MTELLADPAVRRSPPELSPLAAIPLQRASKTVQSKAATHTTTPRLDVLEMQMKRLQNQVRAIEHLDAFKEEVMARAAGWEKAVLSIGSAYAIAAKNHTDAVEAKKKMDAIEAQIMFSVLTIATAGTLSWVGGAAEAAKQTAEAAKQINDHRLLTKVLLDTVSAAGGEVFSANGPGIWERVPTPDQTAVSTDPLVFQNQRLSRLKASEQAAHLQFKAWTEALQSTDPAKWDSYNEQKQVDGYQDWVKKADLLGGSDNLPSIEAMAAELERGFWSRWAPAMRQEYVVITGGGYATGKGQEKTKKVAYVSPGSAIEKRWDVLGITKESGVGDFGWWTSENEIQKVIDWANGYKVKEFL